MTHATQRRGATASQTHGMRRARDWWTSGQWAARGRTYNGRTRSGGSVDISPAISDFFSPGLYRPLLLGSSVESHACVISEGATFRFAVGASDSQSGELQV